MKTILLPTDFSNTSINAAKHAIALAKQTNVTKIVLYHATELPVNVGSDIMIPVDFIDPSDIKKATDEHLEKLKTTLETEAEGIDITILSELNTLVDGIEAIAKAVNADLIVMGITGGGILEEKLIGSNAVSVARQTAVPVVIVPAKSNPQPIERLLLISDFEDIEATTPIFEIKKILNATKASLHILHINEFEDTFAVTYPDKVVEQTYEIHNLFEAYDPEYSYVNNPNFVDAVNQHAAKIGANMVIIIPKKHGWFEGWFTESHTKQLAFHSNLPLLVVHK